MTSIRPDSGPSPFERVFNHKANLTRNEKIQVKGGTLQWSTGKISQKAALKLAATLEMTANALSGNEKIEDEAARRIYTKITEVIKDGKEQDEIASGLNHLASQMKMAAKRAMLTRTLSAPNLRQGRSGLIQAPKKTRSRSLSPTKSPTSLSPKEQKAKEKAAKKAEKRKLKEQAEAEKKRQLAFKKWAKKAAKQLKQFNLFYPSALNGSRKHLGTTGLKERASLGQDIMRYVGSNLIQFLDKDGTPIPLISSEIIPKDLNKEQKSRFIIREKMANILSIFEKSLGVSGAAKRFTDLTIPEKNKYPEASELADALQTVFQEQRDSKAKGIAILLKTLIQNHLNAGAGAILFAANKTGAANINTLSPSKKITFQFGEDGKIAIQHQASLVKEELREAKSEDQLNSFIVRTTNLLVSNLKNLDHWDTFILGSVETQTGMNAEDKIAADQITKCFEMMGFPKLREE